MRIRISASIVLIAAVLGAALGAISGGFVGGIKGAIYGFVAAIAALALVIIPVGGPLISWFVVFPALRRALGLPSSMLAVDIVITAIASLINAYITLAILLIVCESLRD